MELIEAGKINMRTLSQKIIYTTLILCSSTFQINNIYAGGGGNMSCTISAPTANFGTINPNDAIADTTTTTLSVLCNANGQNRVGNATITFSPGGSGNQTSRQMKHTNTINVLGYNVFQDNGYTQIIGSGLGGTSQITFAYSIPKNTSQTFNFTVYGRIPVQTGVIPGSYSDALTVTLTY